MESAPWLAPADSDDDGEKSNDSSHPEAKSTARRSKRSSKREILSKSMSQRKAKLNTSAIKGFCFPLAEEGAVERLEKGVRKNQQTRAKYVSFWGERCGTRLVG